MTTMNNSLKVIREKIPLAKLGRELTVNFISLEDDDWIEENIGAEKLAAAMTPETIDMDIILKLLWRLLDDDSKKMVADVKMMKWEGMVSSPIVYETPEVKLKAIVSGGNEILSIMGALIKTRIKSNPDISKNVKKKPAEENPSTSPAASMSSPEPTLDTPSSNSTNSL